VNIKNKSKSGLVRFKGTRKTSLMKEKNENKNLALLDPLKLDLFNEQITYVHECSIGSFRNGLVL
jgi:hypothetical protein